MSTGSRRSHAGSVHRLVGASCRVGPSDTRVNAGSDDPGPRVGPANGKSHFRFTPHQAGRGH